MAILATAQWWVRAGGDALNGGGFDAEIAGAGTNYCDQDAAQLSLTDLATPGAGSTTLTSATGGFTAAMVGNCWRIASGTNFTAGYYFVTGYTNTNTVTLDRTPTSGGAGSGGTGRLGGAFANVAASLSTGGSVTAPAITSPLAAGHTINIRGGGTDTPASADYTQTGYAQYPSGSTGTGWIRFVGYNGRPRIDCNHSLVLSGTGLIFEQLEIVATAASAGANGMLHFAGSGQVMDVRCDQSGYDVVGVGAQAVGVFGCSFINSGSSAAGSNYAVACTVTTSVVGCYVDGWRGGGIYVTTYSKVTSNVVANCKGTTYAGISVSGAAGQSAAITGNSIFGNGSDGVVLRDLDAISYTRIMNNVIYGNAGYGINASVGTAALNDLRKWVIDYNAFGSNTSGALNNLSAGDNDITLSADPFTNAAGGDFTLNSTAGGGADIDDTAFPTSIP